MTKLSELGPQHAVTVHIPPDARNDSDFYRCETCGQIVDLKDMRQVMWHQLQGDHEPLELDS
ncbi:hypothetical protein [Mesorhizobium sp. CA4]|uniref:hypothetical protein n=1 Tax=Mesorhizobium sp. CA4 TaxID=588499 RepID=UPI001CD0D11F|nr:hypothetical protein [Mesorhizobium sp. CA4]MBZ9822365.1 hypothetical protein [Mesorhizobium sp. CA4]